MSYVIFGRAIKNEYLVLTTLFTTGAIAYASRGKKESLPPPTTGDKVKERLKEVRDTVKIAASSSEEEQFIKQFIAEAEKEDAAAAKH